MDNLEHSTYIQSLITEAKQSKIDLNSLSFWGFGNSVNIDYDHDFNAKTTVKSLKKHTADEVCAILLSEFNTLTELMGFECSDNLRASFDTHKVWGECITFRMTFDKQDEFELNCEASMILSLNKGNAKKYTPCVRLTLDDTLTKNMSIKESSAVTRFLITVQLFKIRCAFVIREFFNKKVIDTAKRTEKLCKQLEITHHKMSVDDVLKLTNFVRSFLRQKASSSCHISFLNPEDGVLKPISITCEYSSDVDWIDTYIVSHTFKGAGKNLDSAISMGCGHYIDKEIFDGTVANLKEFMI